VSSVEPSDEQRAIIEVARRGNESILVEACAGSGKTWTLIECIKVLREPTAVVLAFNKRIADTMAARMPKLPRTRAVHVKTLHAAGLWITNHYYPTLKLDKDESERLVDRACEKGTSLRVRGAALKLLRLVKDFQHERELDADYAYELGFEMSAFDKLEIGPDIQKAIEVTQRAYDLSLIIDEREFIDYCDMGWLPLVLDLQPPHRYKVVLLDEAQDINSNQLAMVERLLVPGGRMIACGDRNQAIYGWRGATPDQTWAILEHRYKTTRYPMTITWRCDQAIVSEANTLVSEIVARPDAGAGAIDTCDESWFYESVGTHDEHVFVLSRTNAELLRVALEMWRRKIPFNIAQSPEVIWPIKNIVAKLIKNAVPEPKPDDEIEEALGVFYDRMQRGKETADRSRKIANAVSTSEKFATFRQNIAAWYITEMMKAQQAGSSTWAERIEEQYRMLLYCTNYVEHPSDIARLLDGIFTEDDTCWVWLSTVHKAKGLEADHVYLLRETFARYRKVRGEDGALRYPRDEEVHPEERNVEYVAITRAKHSLTWVYLDATT